MDLENQNIFFKDYPGEEWCGQTEASDNGGICLRFLTRDALPLHAWHSRSFVDGSDPKLGQFICQKIRTASNSHFTMDSQISDSRHETSESLPKLEHDAVDKTARRPTTALDRRRTLKSTLHPTTFWEMVKFVTLGVLYFSLVLPL